nr:alpha/beta hydrolase [uncultured Flavobacterium sp.]
MEKYAISTDGVKIHFLETGKGNITLVFVHGWLGNGNWWSDQQTYFKDKYKIVQIDLGGHGKSGKSRTNWSSKQYADDINAVLQEINSNKIILIGHSMSGAYVLEASIESQKVKSIILVDTLKDLDQKFTYEQAEEYQFTHYRNNFELAVKNILPQYLFVEATPDLVKEKLQNEFLQNESDFAINALKPLYLMDVNKIAQLVTIPVRAINSDASPTNLDNNRKYLKDYDCTIIPKTGHYPMLEKPDEFNEILNNLINELIELHY